MKRAILVNFGIDAICASIADGNTLTGIAKSLGVSFGTLNSWLESDPERSARAREARTSTALVYDEKAEQAILDAPDPFELSRAKELAHHYRWKAAKLSPKTYGDKLLHTGGDGVGPIEVAQQRYLAISTEKLAQIEAMLTETEE